MATAAQRLVTEAALTVQLDARHLSGMGSPEGVIAAPIGSVYVDLFHSTPARRTSWLKVSGASVATGWQFSKGYIRRDLSSIATGRTSGTVEASMNDGWNGVTFRNFVPSAAGTVELFPAGADFASLVALNAVQGAVPTGSAGAMRRVQVESTGRVVLLSAATSDSLNGTIWWPREQALPATLPGSAI